MIIRTPDVLLRLYPGRNPPNIVSRSSSDVQTLLVGRRIPDVLPQLQAVYSHCTQAHGLAAQLALGAAQSAPVPATRQQSATLHRETLAEHLRTIWLDWPRRLGLLPAAGRDMQCLTQALALTHDLRAFRHWIERSLIGGDQARWLDAWRNRDDAYLSDWRDAAATFPAASLAAVSALARQIATQRDATLPQPTWSLTELVLTEPYETGCWTRHGFPHARHALDRLQARIAEMIVLAGLPDGDPTPLRSGSIWIDEGHGLGWCEAADGIVVHRVQLDAEAPDARIVDYVVRAPADVNFDPVGAAACALSRLGPGAPVAPACAIIVCAFDPAADSVVVSDTTRLSDESYRA